MRNWVCLSSQYALTQKYLNHVQSVQSRCFCDVFVSTLEENSKTVCKNWGASNARAGPISKCATSPKKNIPKRFAHLHLRFIHVTVILYLLSVHFPFNGRHLTQHLQLLLEPPQVGRRPCAKGVGGALQRQRCPGAVGDLGALQGLVHQALLSQVGLVCHNHLKRGRTSSITTLLYYTVWNSGRLQ